jgi:hypothetical protein
MCGKNNLLPSHIFYFQKTNTSKDVHSRIYKLMKPILASFEGLNIEDDFSFYETEILEKVY